MDVKGIVGLLKVLTWQKIVQATVLIFILLITYGFWENRTTVYNSLRVGARVEVEQPMILNLTPGTKSVLNGSASKMKQLIGGIQVVNVNFKKNTQSTSYFAISDDILRYSYQQSLLSNISDTPLFTDVEVNNQRIIDLINGEFICYEYRSTPAIKAFPGASESIPTICSISIPPYYGRFSGYMNVYLVKKPTSDEIGLIRQIARDISLRIYETDIDKSVRYPAETGK
jgi:hypothetical protein